MALNCENRFVIQTATALSEHVAQPNTLRYREVVLSIDIIDVYNSVSLRIKFNHMAAKCIHDSH